jgi:predicted nuclease of predicted toxin-antitoxin system
MNDSKPKFIVDECTGPFVAQWLKSKGYTVLSIYEDLPGLKDIEILKIAQSQSWVIITNDKDFGELVYKGNYSHEGIILLRLSDERSFSKIKVLEQLLDVYFSDLTGNFIVVTENAVRVIKQK